MIGSFLILLGTKLENAEAKMPTKVRTALDPWAKAQEAKWFRRCFDDEWTTCVAQSNSQHSNEPSGSDYARVATMNLAGGEAKLISIRKRNGSCMVIGLVMEDGYRNSTWMKSLEVQIRIVTGL